ncbi:MAG TPA: hypothetical protein VFZ32_21565 [Micromonosporaceae bacterium]
MNTVVMAEDRENGFRPRPSARGSFWGGVAASIAANVLAAPDDLISRLVSGWPAIALFAVVEMLVRPPKKRAVAVPQAAPVTPVSKINTLEDAAPAEPAAPEPVKVSPLVASLPPVWKTSGGQSNAERVRLTAARLPADATLTQIAAAASVSESTVRRYLPADHPLRNGKARKPSGADPEPVGVGT